MSLLDRLVVLLLERILLKALEALIEEGFGKD